LKGEIEFRAKLARQHTTGEVVLPDYYDKEEHDRILLERVNATSETMTELARLGLQFSPFLELGAERGQRSLVVANDCAATGVAADLSFEQLRTMAHFSQLFGREKLPLRVCCDANHLPFKDNVFAFVFCYGFLHHFPSLEPVIREIHRVLGEGHFYFDEEPFKRVLKVRLYRQRHTIYSRTTLRKSRYRRLAESFISEPSSDEVEHGIIENEDISLREWARALEVFDERDVKLASIANARSKLGDRLRLENLANLLLGGTISGVCRKRTAVKRPPPRDLSELFACPDCISRGQIDGADRPALVRQGGGFRCGQCGSTYPERDGVIFLLPNAELNELYPDLSSSGERA
jgi:SAM-dependent methyltransferase/uncharacterized protein YbaR (Trm112 family)